MALQQIANTVETAALKVKRYSAGGKWLTRAGGEVRSDMGADGRELLKRKDAANYITGLPEGEAELAKWQVANGRTYHNAA